MHLLTTPTSPGERWQRLRTWCERHGAVLSLALACLARFPALGAAELSLDEAWGWYLTDEVVRTGEFWRTLTRGGFDAPLFDAVNVLVAKTAGLSLLGLRAPQAVFGAAAVPLIFVLVRRLRDARLAWPVALLAAWSPFLVFYSKDARPYAQLLFFTLVFTYAFAATRHWNPLSRRLLLGGCTVLAVTSHYYALVYLAAFHPLVLAGHHRAGRQAELRADLRTAAITLAAAAPFLFPLLIGLGGLPLPYVQVSDISLPGILVEEFLFLGTTLPHGGLLVTVINMAFALLLVLPLADALRRRSPLIGGEPVLSSLWWLAPGLVAAAGMLIGQDVLFYPRGFISSAPFLFAYWVLFTGALSGPRWARGLYVAVLLVPFVLSGILVASSHPGQAYLRGRHELVEVVRGVDAYRDEFDLILVDHWWMAPYFTFYYPERSKVWALGRGYTGEGAVFEHLARVPPSSRVLLVINDVAAKQTDPAGKVAQALMSTRPLIRELPCPQEALPGRGLVCNRMLLFGAARSGPAAAPATPPAP
jgi:hypothetical protein